VADAFPSYLFCKLRITKIYVLNHSNATLHLNHQTQNIWIIKELAKVYTTSQIYPLFIVIECFLTPDIINYLIHATGGEIEQILKRWIILDILHVYHSQMTSKIPYTQNILDFIMVGCSTIFRT
jgi:hypothetical protein